MLCFIGVISFVHFRFGYLRLSISPNIEKNKMKTNGTAIIITAPKAFGCRAIIAQTLQINAGTAVRRRCMLLFAFIACHDVIGKDCASQTLLPSRETDGADISFVDAIRQIRAEAATQI